MADYSVGNLLLDIKATEQNVDKTLSTVVRRLNSLYRAVDNFSKLNVNASLGKISTFFVALNLTLNSVSVESVNNLSRISRSINTLQSSVAKLTDSDPVLSGRNIDVLFERIAVSVEKIDTAKLERLSALTKSFSSITNISKRIEKIDFAKASAGFTQLATAIDPFIAKVKSAETSLVSLDNVLKKTKTIGGGSGGSSNKGIAKTLNLAGIAGKIYFIMNYTKRLAQTVGRMVQSAIDYTETLNLWQVAMRGNIDTAEEFISKMNKAYGIAEQTLMKYQATFRNMLSTLGGISADVSYGLSESLTQMALDYASLYNTSIDKAMTVFQSVLSGQVRPIRSISGYDITETTIFQLYQQLGGTKTMRQLTQTEKRLLRIYAVFQQMDRSGAIGDLNKTLGNTANQVRIMKEAFIELGTWIGKLFIPILEYVLPKLNAVIITAKNIVQAIVKSMPDYSEFDGTIKGYEETAEAMDEVQGKLLDFDKFRSLDQGQEADLGIDRKLLDGLAQYESLLANVKNEAALLAEKWTALFIDPETGEFTKKFIDIKDTFSTIADLVKSIGVGLLTWKIGKGVLNLISSFKNNKGLGVVGKIGFVAGITAFGGFLASDIIKETDNKLTEITAIISAASLAVGAILALFGVKIPLGIALMAGGALTLGFQTASVSDKLSQTMKEDIAIITSIVSTALLAIGGMLAFSGVNIPLGLGLLATGALSLAGVLIPSWGSISKEVQTTISTIMAIMGGALTVIGLILLFTGVGTGIGLGLLLGGVASLGTALAFNWNFILDGIKKVWGSITNFWDKYIAPVFTKKFWANIGVGIINGIVWFLNGIISVFEDTINFFAEIGDVILSVFGIDVAKISLPRVPELSYYADGGMPDSGTLFVAGEAGAEIVYNTPSGQSGVANIQQIAQAQYQATTRALAEWWATARNDVQFTGEVDGDVLFSSVEKQARRRGKAFGTV